MTKRNAAKSTAMSATAAINLNKEIRGSFTALSLPRAVCDLLRWAILLGRRHLVQGSSPA